MIENHSRILETKVDLVSNYLKSEDADEDLGPGLGVQDIEVPVK